MTITTDTGRRAPAQPGPAPRLRRRPGYAALGGALVVTGGLAAAWLFGTASDARPVVVAAAALPRGHVITPQDLAAVDVAGLTGADLVPAAAAADLVGQTVAQDVPAGLPVPRGALTSEPVPAPGTAIIGVNLPAGRAPGLPLTSGDRVRLVATPRSQDDAAAAADVLSYSATVVGAPTPDDAGTGTVVSVSVPAAQAAEVAALVATDRVALILDAPGGP